MTDRYHYVFTRRVYDSTWTFTVTPEGVEAARGPNIAWWASFTSPGATLSDDGYRALCNRTFAPFPTRVEALRYTAAMLARMRSTFGMFPYPEHVRPHRYRTGTIRMRPTGLRYGPPRRRA